MDFDGIRQDGTLYVANVSRGKDSTAMLFAIEKLGWPLDGIVSVDVWATKTIPAELPPMVAFKDEWDKKVLERFGVPVTRLCAKDKEGNLKSYEDILACEVQREQEDGPRLRRTIQTRRRGTHRQR